MKTSIRCLLALSWGLHSADFRNTFTFELMYKRIQKAEDNTPLQFTFVWGMNDFFNVKGLTFKGFLDLWGEKLAWTDDQGKTKNTEWVLLSEPQLWCNVGQHFGCPNLNVGGEVEVACNFAGGWRSRTDFYKNKGFYRRPLSGYQMGVLDEEPEWG